MRLRALEQALVLREAELTARIEEFDRQKAAFLLEKQKWQREAAGGGPGGGQKWSISPNVLVVDDTGVHMEKIQSLLRRLAPGVEPNHYSLLGRTEDSSGPMSIMTRDLLKREDSQVWPARDAAVWPRFGTAPSAGIVTLRAGARHIGFP